MHDGEDGNGDGFEPEASMGKLYYSGIRPDVERADYALAPGVPALQDGGPECPTEAAEFEIGRGRAGLSVCWRRSFLLYGLGTGLLAGVGSHFLLGPLTGDRDRREQEPRELSSPRNRRLSGQEAVLLEGARTMAKGPVAKLVNAYQTYVWIVEKNEPEDVLWEGIERLGKWALLDRGEQGVRIAKRLLSSLGSIGAPDWFNGMRVELEDMVWKWRLKTK